MIISEIENEFLRRSILIASAPVMLVALLIIVLVYMSVKTILEYSRQVYNLIVVGSVAWRGE